VSPAVVAAAERQVGFRLQELLQQSLPSPRRGEGLCWALLE